MPAAPSSGEERLRLFVALELPDPARASLSRWRDRVARGRSGIRPVADMSLHATLCFLGWQALGDVDAIADACAVVAAQPQPELGVGEAIWLPRRRPRVLAVELDDRSGGLGRVQAALSNVLASGGWYEPEKRPYLAHVTVARVEPGAKAGRSTLPPPPTDVFQAERVTLYRSRLLRSGARYDALRSVSLA